MPDKASQKEQNDRLMVFTYDGDIYEDDSVRQELGILLSDKHEWALPLTEPAGVYSLLDVGKQPMKTRSVFLFRQDPPSIKDDTDTFGDHIYANALPWVYSQGERGKWGKQKHILARAFDQFKYLAFLVLTVAVCGVGWMSLNNSKELELARIAAEVERAAQVATTTQETAHVP